MLFVIRIQIWIGQQVCDLSQVLSWVHYTKINLQQIHIFSISFVSSMKPVLIYSMP